MRLFCKISLGFLCQGKLTELINISKDSHNQYLFVDINQLWSMHITRATAIFVRHIGQVTKMLISPNMDIYFTEIIIRYVLQL